MFKFGKQKRKNKRNRYTIPNIDKDLLLIIKHQAITEGKTISKMISDLLIEGLRCRKNQK